MKSYPNRTNPKSRKPKQEPVTLFYRRLHHTLTALQKIQQQLPREVWAKFVVAYTRHWLYSLEHGEKAAQPGAYYNEWAEVQSLGSIGMASSDDLHAARNYQIYQSPREKARQVLGLDSAPAPIGGEGGAA